MDGVTDSTGVIAVIIGRAGSRGLPGKNALSLLGRPLVDYSLDHALHAERVDRVIVSTDCPQVAAAAACRSVPVIDRPAPLAADTARVDETVLHAVNAAGGDEPVIVILYANVPTRPADLVDRAVDRLLRTGADSVQSYCDVDKYHPYWMVQVNDGGRVSPYIRNTIHRRQDLPPLLIPDGGVLVVRRSILEANARGDVESMFGVDHRAELTERGEVIDIDGLFDLRVAEVVLAGRSPHATAKTLQ